MDRVSARALIAVLSLVVAGCSHGAAPRMPGAVAPPAAAAEPSAVDSILWSQARLRWRDFAARPQITSPAAAITAYVISYEAHCGTTVFNYRVVSAFLPDRSWVKLEALVALEDSDRALRHEQTHFDLSEVSVRRIRRALDEMTDPCARPAREREAVIEALIREDSRIQERYDHETGFGNIMFRQAEWEMTVTRQLAELGKYAGNAQASRILVR